jgi:hypothetical protein
LRVQSRAAAFDAPNHAASLQVLLAR